MLKFFKNDGGMEYVKANIFLDQINILSDPSYKNFNRSYLRKI